MTATLIGLAGWALALALGVAVLRLRRRLELVACAAHELRGPALAIGFAVSALRRERGGPRRALALEAQLERLGAGLADLEAARSGRRAEPRSVAVGVDRLLRGAASGWRPVARAAGRPLRFTWEGAPATVRADSGRLAQAFGNLVANAVEHGSGPVELRGRRAGRRVVLEVRDGRPGRAPAREPNREPAGGSDRAPAGGSEPSPAGSAGRAGAAFAAPRGADRGRGLAIAARAVADAGGTLRLERRDEGQTVAAIELPVADP